MMDVNDGLRVLEYPSCLMREKETAIVCLIKILLESALSSTQI